MIQLREYQKSDYPILVEWWRGHGWSAVPESVLPKLGVVVCEREGVRDDPVCAGFLYMDNSVGVCWLEWIVSNPYASGFSVARGITELNRFMEGRAKEMGYGAMLTCCRQASLARFYERAGFQKTDSGVTHLIKSLGGE